ncbi:hypothetical protein FHX76_001131 [Lysinibacter cavernae]|uniref:Uncharacterized protein n=1 Tax=Lysinibacter cavernae TaxID=1640652 RepID=A0A7X5R0E1_9MICO|nr:hypothetical protein [Lysinibacter cavernae]
MAFGGRIVAIFRFWPCESSRLSPEYPSSSIGFRRPIVGELAQMLHLLMNMLSPIMDTVAGIG